MYNFKDINPAIVLTANYILSKIEDSQIFFYYFGRFQIGKAYCSAFTKDKKPSTTFYINNRGKIIYYDFRTGQTWDCFAFVQELFHVPFNKALDIIAEDFGLIDKKTTKVSPRIFQLSQELDKEVKDKNTLIQFIPEKWNESNLRFWRYYDITRDELVSENVYPIKKLFLNRSELPNYHSYPRYALTERTDNRILVKVYSPTDPKMKWLSSIPLDMPFGLNDLPYESNVVFITKSKKDQIVLKKIFTDVIATQNESTASLSAEVRDLLKRRYDKRVIVFDNDEFGTANAEKLRDEGFDVFCIPREDDVPNLVKDPSDYIRYFGLDMLKQLFRDANLLV